MDFLEQLNISIIENAFKHSKTKKELKSLLHFSFGIGGLYSKKLYSNTELVTSPCNQPQLNLAYRLKVSHDDIISITSGYSPKHNKNAVNLVDEFFSISEDEKKNYIANKIKYIKDNVQLTEAQSELLTADVFGLVQSHGKKNSVQGLNLFTHILVKYAERYDDMLFDANYGKFDYSTIEKDGDIPESYYDVEVSDWFNENMFWGLAFKELNIHTENCSNYNISLDDYYALKGIPTKHISVTREYLIGLMKDSFLDFECDFSETEDSFTIANIKVNDYDYIHEKNGQIKIIDTNDNFSIATIELKKTMKFANDLI